MQSLAIRLGLAGVAASALIGLIPSGGAEAAEPLPPGTYQVVVPAGAIAFEVFYDGAARVLSSPDGVEVTFRFDDDVKVLDEFSVSTPGGAFEVDIDIDEAGGGYGYDVEALPPPQTATSDDAADTVADEPGVTDDEGPDDEGPGDATEADHGRPSDHPTPPACEIAQGKAPEKNPNCEGADTPDTEATETGGTEPASEETADSPSERAEQGSRGQGPAREDVTPGRGRR